MASEFWDKVRKDFHKGYKEGLDFLKVKTTELTVEGKRKYNVYEHKHKAHKEMAELGAMVYEIVTTGGKVDGSAKVRAAVDRIGKIEEQIAKLESGAPKKKTAKKKAPAKKKAASRKKTGAKKKTAAKK
jgi:hypothetical protein